MALTEDYTFKLGDGGVVLNSDSSDLPFVDIKKVMGLDNAPYRETQRDHEGTDGGFMDAEFEKGRPVSLIGDVYSNVETMQDYLDSIKGNYAPSTSLVPFYIKPTGQSERVLFVKPLGARFDWDTTLRVGITEIQFNMFAEDPRIYEAAEQEFELFQSGVVTTGMGFDMGFPVGFGAEVSSGTYNLVVLGNRPTPAVITISGPVTNPELVNDTLGVTLKFNITLVAGQTLVVDLQYHTVLLNGSVNRRGVLEEPNWFFLQVGDNFLRYRAESSIGTSTMIINYRHAWR